MTKFYQPSLSSIRTKTRRINKKKCYMYDNHEKVTVSKKNRQNFFYHIMTFFWESNETS